MMSAYYYLLVLSLLSFDLHDVLGENVFYTEQGVTVEGVTEQGVTVEGVTEEGVTEEVVAEKKCKPYTTPWKDLCEEECIGNTKHHIHVFHCRNKVLSTGKLVHKRDWVNLTFDDAEKVSRFTFINYHARSIVLKNSFYKFEPNSFTGLTVKTLEITNNTNLVKLSSTVFKRVIGLEVLSLKNNSISTLPGDIFDGLKDLLRLYIQDNSISCFAEDLFHPLRSLMELRMDQNVEIKGLGVKTFKGIKANVHYKGQVDKCIVDCNYFVSGLTVVDTGQTCDCDNHKKQCKAKYNVVYACAPKKTPWSGMCSTSCQLSRGPKYVHFSKCETKVLKTASGSLSDDKLTLVFDSSNITTVKYRAFNGYTLFHLKLMHSFKSFKGSCFSGLNVTTLDIVYNKDLRSLPGKLLNGIIGLQEFKLGGHQIQSLPAGIFRGVSSLKRLSLFESNFKCFSRDLFAPLKNVEVVAIDQEDKDGLCVQSFKMNNFTLITRGSIDKCIIECSRGVKYFDIIDNQQTCHCKSMDDCKLCEEFGKKGKTLTEDGYDYGTLTDDGFDVGDETLTQTDIEEYYYYYWP